MEQSSSLLKHLSALLTLLLAALLAGSPSASDAASGRSSARILIELDIAHSPAFLGGQQGAKSVPHQTDGETDSPGAAIFPPALAADHFAGVEEDRQRHAASLSFHQPLPYRARAPPRTS